MANLTGANRMSSQLGLQLLAENLGEYKLLTDIANINYTRGEKLICERSLSSNSITEPFCDHLKLVQICENSQWNEQYSHECQNYLIEKFFKIPSPQPNFSVEPSREAPVSLHANSQTVNAVWEIIQEKPVAETYLDPLCVFYHATFENVELKHLLRGDPNIFQTLEDNNYFLMELHISQDFVGIFEKTEMCNYLLKNYNFCYNDGDSEVQNSYNVIRKHENLGIDSISWRNANTMVRIYNKFINQITNPGCNKIGNRIIDFINPSNKQLQKTFLSSKAKEHGITGLKLTIYNYECDGFEKKYEPLSECLHLLETNKMYLEEEDAPMYSVSIPKMWQKLTDFLLSSCCVVCDNILQFAYWGNSYTEKFTGVQVVLSKNSLEREKQINHALSQFSFNNLPVNYVEAIRGENEISQNCFQKSGKTFFTRSDILDHAIPAEVDITSTGLIQTDHVIPEVLRKGKTIPNIYTIKEIKPTFLVRKSIYPVSAPNSQEIESQLDELSAAVQSIAISNEENEEPVTIEETIESSSDHVTSPNQLETELDDMSNAMGTMSIQNEQDEAEEQEMVKIAEKLSLEFRRSSPQQIEPNLNDVNDSIEENTSEIEEEEEHAIVNIPDESSVQIHESEPKLNDVILPNETTTIEDDEYEQEMLEITNRISQEFNESRLNDTNHPVEQIAITTEESEEETIEEPKFEVLDYFKEKNWKPLDPAGAYEIYAFTVKRKGRSYVGILASKKNEDSKNIYNLKGPQKDRFIRCHNKREFLTQQGYLVSATAGLIIIHLPSENPFAEFQTNGTESYQGNSVPKIENMKFHTDGWKNYEDPTLENVEQDGQILGETRDSLFNLFLWKNWKNLDQDGEYQVYAFTVNHIVRYPCVGVLAKKKNSHSKHVYFVKGVAKLNLMDRYRDRHTLIMIDHAIIYCNNLEIVYLDNEQPLAEFKTNGVDTYKNSTFPKIVDVRFFSITSEQYEDAKSEIVEELASFEETRDQISTLFKRRNWKRLNQIGEYIVYAFTVDEEPYCTRVGVLAKEVNEDSKHVYCIERKNTEEFKLLYDLRELLTLECYDMIKLDDSDVLFLATKLPLAKFNTNGMDSKDSYTFPKIEDIHFL